MRWLPGQTEISNLLTVKAKQGIIAHGMRGDGCAHCLRVGPRDGSNTEIYVMNADGTGLTRLTDDPGGDRRTRLVARRLEDRLRLGPRRQLQLEIYVMNADGTARRASPTTAASDVEPAWSPDGSKIAFASDRDGNWEIYVMNADGTAQTRLTNDAVDDQSPCLVARRLQDRVSVES